MLGRGPSGNLYECPLLELIAEDPILRDSKYVAEAWDAAGAYEVGSFSEPRWGSWNDRFRDEVRRFWRGDDGMLGFFASRICGIADIYSKSGKAPKSSIDFSHLSQRLHFERPGGLSLQAQWTQTKNSATGPTPTFSQNYGSEGETKDAGIETLRKRQIKNLLLTLLISRGVPMLLGGDEFRRTQGGNNNAYCQDNETSWFDWTDLEQHQEIFRFAHGMITFRRAHPPLSKEQFYTVAEIRWFSPQQGSPNWTDPERKKPRLLDPGKRTRRAFPDVQRWHEWNRLWFAAAAARVSLGSSGRHITLGAARLV